MNKEDNTPERGLIRFGEYHPAAESALKWLGTLPYTKLIMYQGAFASCAIEGNRLGEICAATIQKLLDGKPVGDRYLLGLAWELRDMEEKYRGDKFSSQLEKSGEG